LHRGQAVPLEKLLRLRKDNAPLQLSKGIPRVLRSIAHWDDMESKGSNAFLHLLRGPLEFLGGMEICESRASPQPELKGAIWPGMGHMDGGHQLLVSGINTAATIRTGGQLRLSNAQLGGQMVAEHLPEVQHKLLRTEVALLQLLHMALTKDLHGLIASRWILAIPRTPLILLLFFVAAGGGGRG